MIENSLEAGKIESYLKIKVNEEKIKAETTANIKVPPRTFPSASAILNPSI